MKLSGLGFHLMSSKKKAQQKREQKRARRKRTKPARRISNAFLSEADRIFWLAHGVNFLSSDYTTGEWSPLIPEVYRGPITEDFLVARMKKLAQGTLDGRSRAILGYALQDAVAIYAFKRRAEKLVAERNDAKLPHQPIVWQMFHEQILVKALAKEKNVR